MNKKLSQYKKWKQHHKKSTLNIIRYLQKVIKKTLPYHTTELLVKDLKAICNKTELLGTENKRLKKKIKIVKIGNFKMPEFEADLPFGNKIETLEMAYRIGWECGILKCNEILSKPLKEK